ncbi:MAG: T9SS type A sorting domain-containing protein [Bacteroidia bacterium]
MAAKLNIGLSLHNDTMNRNNGCVGLVGSIDEPPFVPMLISPNPAGNRFTINSSHINEIGTLIIYDLSGR